MAARRNRRGRRRNRGRFGVLYKLLSILIICAAILVGCVVFFRVNEVVVSGETPYTAQEIIAASGVEQGDNLFGLNKYQIVSRICTRLPYVDTVNPVRKYPDTLILYVTESRPVAWIEADGARWLLDGKCKVLERVDSGTGEGLAELIGLTPINLTVGSKLTVAPEQQEKLDQLGLFLAAIAERQMTGSLTSFIDLTTANEIRFGYGENLTVIFPLMGDFQEKTYDLKGALEAMDERGVPRSGTLNLNYESQDGQRIGGLLPERWLPGQATEPAQTPESTAAPEESPAAQEEGNVNEEATQ